MNKTLYIHPGWSKTGTSALQKSLHQNREALLKNGILYPVEFQWKDHAHHNFALAFKGNSGPYSSEINGKQALSILQTEIKNASVPKVLISSELSPLYFRNKNFLEFVKSHFDEVRLIFTVRFQSELLLSLFSQLVCDPNIRYPHSIFHLFTQNIHWLDFALKISKWEEFVPKDCITVFSHSDEMVPAVLAYLGITTADPDRNNPKVLVSTPAKALLAIQKLSLITQKPAEFSTKRNMVLSKLEKLSAANPLAKLFSKEEQFAVDGFYAKSNGSLTKNYSFFGHKIEVKKNYQDVFSALPENLLQ